MAHITCLAFSDDGEASGAGVGDTILDQHIIDQLLGIGLAEDTTAAYQGEKQYDQQRYLLSNHSTLLIVANTTKCFLSHFWGDWGVLQG